MKNRRITNLLFSSLACVLVITTPSLHAAEILIDSSILDQAMDVIGAKY